MAKFATPPRRCATQGEDIYGIDEKGKLKEFYCFHDDKRVGMTGEGKKGYILVEIWENCKEVQGNDTYWWYDHWLEKKEKQEIGKEVYDPPKVHLETFVVTKYSFDSSNSFICVTKKAKDTLLLGSKNRSRFREMIRKELVIDKSAQEAT
nr:hypothetical protein [Tanacetum cinerariifolium]